MREKIFVPAAGTAMAPMSLFGASALMVDIGAALTILDGIQLRRIGP